MIFPVSNSLDAEPKRALKEQLRLFAFEDRQELVSAVPLRIQEELSKRDRVEALLQGELNFHGENSRLCVA